MTWGFPNMGAGNQPSTVSRHIVQMAAAAETERLHRWKIATDAYYGRLPNTIVVKPNKPNDNVRINYARLFVDKGAAFLFGKEVNFEIDEDRTTPEEDYLEKVWRKNRKMTFLNTLGVNGGLYGHVFVRLLPPGPDRSLPRLIALDPMTVTVKWDEDDIDRVRQITVSYPTLDVDNKPKTKRQRFVQNDGGSTWTITEEEGTAERQGWAELSAETWAYPFPPIFHCQNLPAPNEFWGVADLELDAIELLQAMNFTISNIRKILRYHGHPRTIGYGFNAQQFKADTDEITILPNPDARLSNLEMFSDLGSGMAFWKELKAALHAVMRMPEVALGNMEGVGALSGVALKIVYQPLLDKTESKRRLYGEMLAQINGAFISLFAGSSRTDVDEITVNTVWPEMLPRDEQMERQMAQRDKDLGVASTETISGKLGYDYDMEQKRIKKEKEANVELTTPPQLVPFAKAAIRGETPPPPPPGQAAPSPEQPGPASGNAAQEEEPS